MNKLTSIRNPLLPAALAALCSAGATSAIANEPSTAAPTASQKNHQARLFAVNSEGVRNAILGRLARSASLAGTDIGVRVDGHTATLTGIVATEQEKQRAERLARQVSSVREVVNELRLDAAAVNERRDIQVADEVLAQRVAERLAQTVFPWAKAEQDWLYGWEVDGVSWEFDVDVDGGRVSLDGHVDNEGMRSEAIAATRSVPGVVGVDAAELLVEDGDLLVYPTFY